MKQLLLIAFVLFISFAFARGQTQRPADSPKLSAQDERDQQQLISLTKEISLASVQNDQNTLNRLMDERFVLKGVSGKTFGKAELIKRWAAKDSNPHINSSSIPSDFQVFLYGDTAIVISTITDVERREKGAKTIRTSAFDVWKRTEGGWRWIASRETLLPE